MSFTYLASPYSHKNRRIEVSRYRDVRRALGWMLNKGIWAYSPIVHCHHLAIAHDLPKNAEFWMDYNFSMLKSADSLTILKMDGWKESAGLNAEVLEAALLGKPFFHIEPEGGEYVMQSIGATLDFPGGVPKNPWP